MTRRRSSTPLLPVLLVAGLLLGSCSSDSGEGSDESSATTEGAAASTTSTTVAEIPVPDAETVPTLPIAERLEAELEIPSPDWMVADGEFLYVKRDDGVIDQIDPGNNQATSVADLSSEHCAGIGAGFGSLWACQDGDVVPVDPETGDVGAPLGVTKAAVQGHLATGFDRVWVLTGDGSELVGVDPDKGGPDEPIALGVRGTDVAVDDQWVWVVSSVDDAVVRVSPDTGEVDTTIGGLTGPASIAFGADSVWIGGSSAIYEVDQASGEVLRAIGGGVGADGAIAVSHGADETVWVRNAAAFVRQVDAASGHALEEITADVTSGGDAIVAFDRLWTTAYDDSTLFRLDIS